MKKTYMNPKVRVYALNSISVIASSMYLREHVVSNVDELAVKSNNSWGDIWDDDNNW